MVGVRKRAVCLLFIYENIIKTVEFLGIAFLLFITFPLFLVSAPFYYGMALYGAFYNLSIDLHKQAGIFPGFFSI